MKILIVIMVVASLVSCSLIPKYETKCKTVRHCSGHYNAGYCDGFDTNGNPI